MTITVERRSLYPRQRVFIVDDHPLVREWLANVINQQWDLTVCGESEGRENCIEAIQKKKPHVAVVDISLKDCSDVRPQAAEATSATRMAMTNGHSRLFPR